jgi:hypothetical protein
MRHHEETIAGFVDFRTGSPDTLGVVVVGSVARGDERVDSDVDVYVVLTDAAYAAAERAGAVAYVSRAGVTYDGGYVDVKLASPSYLRAAADHGDDPTRASFDRAQVRLDRTGDLTALIGRMTELPEGAWAHRVHAYRAQLALYGQYFLRQAYDRHDRFLLQHSATHAALSAGRCALAQSHRLFRGQKYLTGDLTSLDDLPEGFFTAWMALLTEPTPDAADRLVAVIDGWLGAPLTLDEALSAFIVGNELAWLRQSVPPEYW